MKLTIQSKHGLSFTFRISNPQVLCLSNWNGRKETIRYTLGLEFLKATCCSFLSALLVVVLVDAILNLTIQSKNWGKNPWGELHQLSSWIFPSVAWAWETNIRNVYCPNTRLDSCVNVPLCGQNNFRISWSGGLRVSPLLASSLLTIWYALCQHWWV